MYCQFCGALSWQWQLLTDSVITKLQGYKLGLHTTLTVDSMIADREFNYILSIFIFVVVYWGFISWQYQKLYQDGYWYVTLRTQCDLYKAVRMGDQNHDPISHSVTIPCANQSLPCPSVICYVIYYVNINYIPDGMAEWVDRPPPVWVGHPISAARHVYILYVIGFPRPGIEPTTSHNENQSVFLARAVSTYHCCYWVWWQ